MIFPFAILIAHAISTFAACPSSSWTASTQHPTRCYLPVITPMSWFAAENYCKGQAPNAHISSIENRFESTEVGALLENNPNVHNLDRFWLGGSDLTVQGQFAWTDGSPFKYTNWDSNEPSTEANLDCIDLEIRDSSRWRAKDCGEQYFFVCAVG